jgi:aryl-alcohol dehydrogenase-like predicted oxidoreductase
LVKQELKYLGCALAQCRLVVTQMKKHQSEVEILPLAQSEQMGVITYSPLGGGLLTGKYGVNRKPAEGRLVEHEMYTRPY